MRAIIRLMPGNHEIRERSIKLVTIFGVVYAPRSKTEVNGNVALVPEWVFINAGLNPCQMVTGFEGTERGSL